MNDCMKEKIKYEMSNLMNGRERIRCEMNQSIKELM